METRTVEIRDRHTFIPAVAVKLASTNAAQRYLLGRCGYAIGRPYVLLAKLADGEGRSDPYDWVGSRTMQAAHLWILEHFDEIEDGAVVDVEHILGETPAPKRSERDEP